MLTQYNNMPGTSIVENSTETKLSALEPDTSSEKDGGSGEQAGCAADRVCTACGDSKEQTRQKPEADSCPESKSKRFLLTDTIIAIFIILNIL